MENESKEIQKLNELKKYRQETRVLQNRLKELLVELKNMGADISISDIPGLSERNIKDELVFIREVLEGWGKHQKESIEIGLKDIGESISVADFSGLPEDDKWKWHLEYSDTAAELKKTSVRHACFLNDAANSSLHIGLIGSAIADMVAAEWSIRLSIQADGEMSTETAKSAFARIGAIAKIANDPKQKEKTFIFKCWQDWQKKPDTYAYKAEFAKDMIAKCEHLKSQKKVEDWCREWEKANPAG